MRVLIDENLPGRLRNHLSGHECRTVKECGWSGKKNGDLLALAEPDFDVLLTVDKSLPDQQNISSRQITLLVIRARSNRYKDVAPLMPACLETLTSIRPGEVPRVGN
jgi:predicted nuclease of predicted toxin-antitoxin system